MLMLITMLDNTDMGSPQGEVESRDDNAVLRSWLISGCKKSKYVSPELRKRGRTTRQTECPYQVKIRYLKRESM